MFLPAGFTPEAGAACSRRIAAMPDRGRLADGKSRDEPRPARLRFQWRPLPTAQKKLRTGKTGPELQLRTYGRGLHARKFTLPCFSFSGIFCRTPPRHICRRAAGSPCGRLPCIALPAARRGGRNSYRWKTSISRALSSPFRGGNTRARTLSPFFSPSIPFFDSEWKISA